MKVCRPGQSASGNLLVSHDFFRRIDTIEFLRVLWTAEIYAGVFGLLARVSIPVMVWTKPAEASGFAAPIWLVGFVIPVILVVLARGLQWWMEAHPPEESEFLFLPYPDAVFNSRLACEGLYYGPELTIEQFSGVAICVPRESINR